MVEGEAGSSRLARAESVGPLDLARGKRAARCPLSSAGRVQLRTRCWGSCRRFTFTTRWRRWKALAWKNRESMAEAWGWYRAMLRSSRMVGRHAGLVERSYGARMHDLATKRILRWAADERVDARMLRRALDDVLAADRLTAPVSDALKIEYLARFGTFAN